MSKTSASIPAKMEPKTGEIDPFTTLAKLCLRDILLRNNKLKQNAHLSQCHDLHCNNNSNFRNRTDLLLKIIYWWVIFVKRVHIKRWHCKDSCLLTHFHLCHSVCIEISN